MRCLEGNTRVLLVGYVHERANRVGVTMIDPVEPSVVKGRRELMWLVGAQLAITFVGVAAGLASGQNTWPRLFRLVTSVLFAVAAFRGARWATVIMGVLFGLASVEFLRFSLVAFDHLSYLAVVFVVGSVLLAVMAVYLLFSPHLRAFQAFVRTRRADPSRTRAAAQRREWAERYEVRK